MFFLMLRCSSSCWGAHLHHSSYLGVHAEVLIFMLRCSSLLYWGAHLHAEVLFFLLRCLSSCWGVLMHSHSVSYAHALTHMHTHMHALKTHNYECTGRQHGERCGRLNMNVFTQNGERANRDVAQCLRSCIHQPTLLCFRWTWPPSQSWKVSTLVWITAVRCSCRSWGEPSTSSTSAPASSPARIHWTRVVAARAFRVPSSTDSPRFACLFVF